MPIPVTKIFLAATTSLNNGFRLTGDQPADMALGYTGVSGANWLTGIASINGDTVPDIIVGVAGSDDKAVDAGRVYVIPGSASGGTTASVGQDALNSVIIDGVNAGDRAGAAVGTIADLNADGRVDILVGAPGMEHGAVVDAGAGFALLTPAVPGGIDLADPASGGGGGYVLWGQAAGDAAGSAITSISDLNGDGKAEVLIGAPGNDAGGTDAGAAYVSWGKATAAQVQLTTVAAGTGGFRIRGEAAGDGVGQALGSLTDQNADGKAEILLGAAGNDAGGTDAGAAYVVFGKSTGTEVLLSNIAAGTGGYRIIGTAGEQAGAAVAGLADVNGDGRADILVAAPGSGRAYVVFGKTNTTQVLLSDVAAGSGGYAITAESAGDVAGMSITAGGDFNRDGVADLIIGTPHNGEGGADAGAVYVVWGGGHTNIDLALVAQGIGGAKIVGSAGSLTGAAVATLGDLNADGTPDLFIGSPGSATESASVVYASALWQPDANIYGTTGADAMVSGYGGLHVIGETADVIYGLAGNDIIDAAGGADQVDGGAGDDSITGGAGDDTLMGGLNNDTLLGGAGHDSLDGGAGTDSLVGGDGNDVYVVDSAADVIVELAGGGTDTVQAGVAYTLAAELEALVLTGTAHAGTGNAAANTLTGNTGNDTLLGLGGADTLIGDAGNDSLDGGTGADSLDGGTGNDTYVVDDLGDVVTEALGAGTDTVQASLDWTLGENLEALVLTGTAHQGTGNSLANTLTGGTGNDTLLGLGGNDSLVGAGGDDSLDGGAGTDTMVGGAGNDTYLVDATLDVVTEAAGGGNDTVFASADYTLSAEIEALVLTGAARRGTGNAAANTMTANDLGDTLAGGAGHDTLIGGTGDDSLDGGTGNDSLVGGAGNDTYVVDSASDVIVELTAGGNDTVQAGIDYTLSADIESLVLTGSARHGIGNAQDNSLTAAALGNSTLEGAGGADTLTGGAGNDSLDGGTGADSMAGGAGDDTYLVENAADIVTEAAGGGTDTVVASIDWTLGANQEALVLVGTAHVGIANDSGASLTGGTGADTLIGGIGNDRLDGGSGADSMTGGAGDDTYVIDNAGDVVVELAGGGNDTVIVSSDWTLADNIEAVQLLGSGHALTGNAANNVLSGNSGSDTLDGGSGDDTELGGDGDDVLISAAGNDTLSGGAGHDRYVVKGGSAHIEDFLGNDTIDASDAAGDCVIDLSGDTASSVDGQTLSFGTPGTSAAPLDVQFLQDLTGSFADDIITVRGLVPAIVTALQGIQPNSEFGVSTFRDKPVGGFGGAGDWVYEQSLALSTNTVALTNAYTGMVANNGADGPEAQIEALMQLALRTADVGYRANSARFVVLFTDAPFHQAGDGIAAGITVANNGDAILDGTPPGTGEDYPMIAQVRLALEAANIIPIFCVAGGNDLAYQGLVTALGRGTEVTLTSNSSNVVAAITAGMSVVTTTRVENAWGGAGNDVLKASIADTHLTGNGGHDTLLGATGNDSLDGGAGNDSLDGGAGDDSMAGGLGNDTYMVDGAGDLVVEGAGEGTDTVNAAMDYTLGANLEALVLSGTAHAGTGNALDNTLTGNDLGDTLTGDAGRDTLNGGTGNDSLDGGLGADSMAGGAGDDIYDVDDAGDVVVEGVAGGTDTVHAQVKYTLGANLEALVLEGVARSGSGNALDNTITGNDLGDTLAGGAGLDTLTGGAGNDYLDGGLGADSLAGGAGNDTYAVDNAGDVVSEFAAGGTDTVRTTLSAYTLGADLEKLSFTGIGDFTGTGNALANAIAGGAGNDSLFGGEGNDGLNGGLGADSMVGGLGNDTYTVDNLGDVVVEAMGEGTDAIRTTLGTYTLGATVENLSFTGVGAFTGTGNALANAIAGGAGNDSLFGGEGNDGLNGGLGADSMVGGLGNDTYTVDNLGDVVVEAMGEGTDAIRTTLGTYTLGATVENLSFTGVGAFTGTGNALANAIAGGAGNDSLFGGEGNDGLNGGLGADSMVGGLGNDTYTVDNLGDVVVEAMGEGTDTVRTTLGTYTLGTDLENLSFTGVGDFTGTGNALANAIAGGTGNDSLFGGEGNDGLNGGLGADSMVGGLGNDTYTVDNLGDVVVEAMGEGTDAVRTTLSAYTLGSDVENLSFTGVGAFTGTGNALANAIAGGTGNDMLDGGAGADRLTGGLGNDTLVGGLGLDRLSGGGGADVFRFGNLTERGDTILDFQAGTDVLEFSASGFGGGLSEGMDLGVDARFVLGSTATQAFGQFIYTSANGALYWDADGTGAGAKMEVASLTGLPGLSAADMHIFG